MDDKLGDPASLYVAHWNCSCEAAPGSPLLLAPLAAAAGGWITACKDNGNEHFTPIFVDYSWSAGLDLGEDCHCLVFTQSAFPFFQSSLR